MKVKACIAALAMLTTTACSATSYHQAMARYDFAYRVAGDRGVAPVQVFDDGVNTYLQFSQQHRLPAIFAVSEYGQSLVDFRRDGPYIVVPGVGNALFLQLANRQASVEYSGTIGRQPGKPLPARGPQFGLVAPLQGDSPAQTDRLEVKGQIQFARGKATFAGQSNQVLQRLFTQRAALDSVHIVVRGDDTYNDGLAAKRGEAIAKWFRNQGVDASRIAISERGFDPLETTNPASDVIVSYQRDSARTAGAPELVQVAATHTGYEVLNRQPVSAAAPTGSIQPRMTAGYAPLSQAPAMQPAVAAAPAYAPRHAFHAAVGTAEPVQKVTPSIPVPPAPEVAPPSPPKTPAKEWEAAVGSTLRTSVQQWADEEGWYLKWDAEGLDYRMEAPLRVKGDFIEAVSTTFIAYERAARSFLVDIYPSQKLVVVQEDL